MDYTTTGNNIFVIMAAIIGLFLLAVMIFYIRAWLLDELDDYSQNNSSHNQKDDIEKYSLHNSRKDRIIEEESILISKIKELNKEYKFNRHIQKRYFYEHQCYSKADFDKTDINYVFRELISEEPTKFRYIIDFLNENKSLYSDYLHHYNELLEQYSNATESINTEKLLARQALIAEKRKLTPTTITFIEVTKTYISPQGRNKYLDKRIFSSKDIMYALKHPVTKKVDHYFTEFERSKMTNSLRYDILKRDGFKCTICGATANDGAKLHVDHIKPVSKGGKTEPSNLRTLCEKCNSGKRDKYEENGIN